MPHDWMETVCGVSVESPPTPDEGIEALTALATELAAMDKASAIEHIAAWISEPRNLRLGLVAQRALAARVDGILLKIGRRHGFKALVQSLSLHIKRMGEQEEEERRAARADEAARRTEEQQTTSLAERLGNPDLPPVLCCPKGWDVQPAELARVRLSSDDEEIRTTVAHRPLLISGRLRDIADGRTSLRVEWPRQEGWQHRVVAREKLMEARALVALAGHDAPVTSNNAADMVQFLADFEAKNSEALPEARVTSTMGWQGRGGALGFLWGRTHLQAGVAVLPALAIEDTPPSAWTSGSLHLLAEEGASEIVAGFQCEGTLDGWREVVELALPYPTIMLSLYAAVVPPLLVALPTVPNFILDLCGETSRGKTTAMRAAASVWGSPDERDGGLVKSWDATRVWIERTAGLLSSLPLFLDDTKRAKRPDEVGKTLYDFANGIGRGRGSLDGTRASPRWRSVMISTGEAPATSFTQDGGTKARTLTFWGSPFGGDGVEQAAAAEKITRLSFAHYGHAGPAIVRWMLDTPDAHAQLRARYESARDRWSALSNGNGVAHRAAQYVAVLEVAASVLHEVLGVPVPAVDPVGVAWAAVCAASHEADRAADALRDVLSWATGQQHRFWGRAELDTTDQKAPPAGWLGAWPERESWPHIAILPTELSDFLEKRGYDPEAILKTWDGRGWLNRDAEHRAKKVTIAGRKERCLVLTRAACDLVSGG